MIDEQKLEDLLVEWQVRRQNSQEASAGELCHDSPGLLSELQKRIALLKETDWMFDPDQDEDGQNDAPLADILNRAKNQELVLPSIPFETCVRSLSETGLVSKVELDRLIPDPSTAPADGSILLRQLLAQGKLTRHQVVVVAEGKAKSLVLGNYVILDKIGEGGMGQVFLARHRRMNRLVALKLLPQRAVSSAIAAERFRREVEVAAKLVHPNIVTAYDADEANGTHFLVMEYVEGQDLASLVKRSGPLPIRQAVAFMMQAATGLGYAHERGVIHRDIKPSNLLVDRVGNIKVLDLGLARMSLGSEGGNAPTQAELTQEGAVLGTVDYMAPEQALNTKDADGRADIYALGCTLSFLLTGRAIYPGKTLMQKMLAHREDTIPSLRSRRKEIPESLDALFQKAVAKKPEDRFQSMAEMKAALSACHPSLPLDDGASAQLMRTAQPAALIDTASECGSEATLPDRHPSESPVPSTVSSPPRRKTPFIMGLVLLLLFGGWSFWAVMFKVETSEGTLSVTVDDPNAVVSIDQDQHVKVEYSDDRKTITIAVLPGSHLLKVTSSDGLRVFSETVLVEQGDHRRIEAKLEPRPDEIVHDLDRTVAASILRDGGRVIVVCDGEPCDVTSSSELPRQRFSIWKAFFPETTATPIRLERLRGLSRIEALTLRRTQVVDSDLRAIVQLSSLTTIDLNNTGITDAGTEILSKMPHLTTLWLAATAITDAGFRNLSKLRLLHLAVNGTRVTDAGLECLKDHKQLLVLHINSTDTTDAPLAYIGQLSNLQSLYVGKRTTNAGVRLIQHLKLTSLGLDAPQITDEALSMVGVMTQLRSLHIQDSAVTDSGIRKLRNLSALVDLDLSRSRVTAEGVRQLQELLPKCNIRWEPKP
jgi:serine/threonine protein kinase